MAQSMLMSSFGGGMAERWKEQPLIQFQIRRLRPTPVARDILLPLLPPSRPLGSPGGPTLAVFKAKVRASPAKVPIPRSRRIRARQFWCGEGKAQGRGGIFGTSGGIGFTKPNELFVGRVAMIGFAASLLGEGITGKGILSQVNLETGIPIYEAEPLLLFFILFTLLGAIGALGDRGRFVDDPPTGLERAIIPRERLETGPAGDRLLIIGEIITGKGALAQLNIESGVPINELEPLVLFSVAFFFFAALNRGTGKFVTDEEQD
ncbi:unnamed protein product [Spirodela intermedia]|uniref:Uncharacterized protein n=1 Tax=Spirodela intermedia TaxID=51605 RepID=A0A7I8IRW0_SPIIN|nr:unnamed protein product [Spirodela intermedia]CAA6660594.1 unnamed protein product [Spirodela intermedia]